MKPFPVSFFTSFFFLGSLLFHLSCHNKKEVVFSKIRDSIRDDHWVDDNTLQLLVPGKKIQEKIPLTAQRKKSCRYAKKNIKSHFKKKYPQINKRDVSTEIRYTLYSGDGVCQLVVWFNKRNLKDELSAR